MPISYVCARKKTSCEGNGCLMLMELMVNSACLWSSTWLNNFHLSLGILSEIYLINWISIMHGFGGWGCVSVVTPQGWVRRALDKVPHHLKKKKK